MVEFASAASPDWMWLSGVAVVASGASIAGFVLAAGSSAAEDMRRWEAKEAHEVAEDFSAKERSRLGWSAQDPAKERAPVRRL